MARLKKKSYSDGSIRGWQMVLDDKTLYDGSKTIFYSVHEYKESDVEKRLLLARDIESTMKKRGKLTADIEEDLRRFPDLHRALIEKGVVQSAPDITLDELFDRYLQDGEARGWAPNTISGNRNECKRARALLGVRIVREITKQDALDFDAQLNKLVKLRELDKNKKAGIASATRAGCVRRMKRVFKFAVENGLIEKSPFESLVAGSQVNPDNQRHVTPEETLRILDACRFRQHPAEWRALIALYRMQGLRRAEPKLLRWRDVDFEEQWLTIHAPKNARYGKGERKMTLFPDTARILKELRDEQGLGKDDFILQHVRAENPLSTFQNYILIDAGIPDKINFQHLRKSLSSDIERRFGGFVESLWVGHSQKVAQDFYLHLTPETIASAKEYSLL